MRRSVGRGVGALVLGVIVIGRAAGAQTLPVTPLGFAAFGLEGVSLGAGTRVAGDVGTNGGDITLRPGVRITGNVGGEAIVMRRGSRATNLFCVQVQGGRKDCQPLPDPVVDSVQLPVVQVSPGTEDVILKARARRIPLQAGRFREIAVGRKAELLLAGGEYAVAEVTLARGARLTCLAPCRIDVRRGVDVAAGGRITLLAGAGGDGTLSIQGAGIRDGLTAGSRARITGVVYAPTRTIVVGGRARLVGSLVGRTVAIGRFARLARGDA